jgi:hypothetical protein
MLMVGPTVYNSKMYEYFMVAPGYDLESDARTIMLIYDGRCI